MSGQGSGSQGPQRLKRWVIWVIGIVAVLIVVLVVILATVPVPQTSSFGFTMSSSGSQTLDYSHSLCPVGATASVSYSTDGGRVLTISVLEPNGTTIWNSHSTQGNTTFPVQTCGTYQFALSAVNAGSASVNVTLSYSAPIL
jgi:hypothetical protein